MSHFHPLHLGLENLSTHAYIWEASLAFSNGIFHQRWRTIRRWGLFLHYSSLKCMYIHRNQSFYHQKYLAFALSSLWKRYPPCDCVKYVISTYGLVTDIQVSSSLFTSIISIFDSAMVKYIFQFYFRVKACIARKIQVRIIVFVKPILNYEYFQVVKCS